MSDTPLKHEPWCEVYDPHPRCTCRLAERKAASEQSELAALREQLADAKRKLAEVERRSADLECRLAEVGKDILQRMLAWRDIETPCKRCGGSGIKTYANTATWRGGIGGSAMTMDVCDACWGSGDSSRKGADLRTLTARLKDAERKLATARVEGMEEAARICEQQAHEPECPERAQHCADAIRAAKERK